MALLPGTRIGPYEITAVLGAGGMGEVYRARDTKLGRDVALKVLPAAFATEPDRVTRFAREARTLAALNHPHIGQIFGVEESGGSQTIVMELIEGESLDQRLARGPLPLHDALSIARQTADALEAAHEAGIVHRDFKPANVRLRPDGTVKVLDFGIAKTMVAETGATVTAAPTEAGTILGTAAYMSPEQARAQPVDKRTDNWAFGCVLFEMLTGRAPFARATPSDTIVAILSEDPHWSRLPAGTPPHVRVLLERCLQKDPRRRLRDIGDARLDLDLPLAGSPAAEITGAYPAPRRRTWAIAGLALLAVVTVIVTAALNRPRPAAPSAPVRVTVRLASGITLTRGPQFASPLAIAPDGRRLALAGRDATGYRIYQRPMDRLEATPIPGTEGGSSPFFSADGRWIGFFVGGRLKRVQADGGPAVDIAIGPVPQLPKGASWGADDRIVFATGAFTALYIVKVDGGTAEPLTQLDTAAGEVSHAQPEVLPNPRHVLFSVHRQGRWWIDAIDVSTGRRKRIIEGAAPRYAPSGHLAFTRGGTLMVAPFDASSVEVTGDAVPVVDDVSGGPNGAWFYDLSSDGTLAYMAAPRSHLLVVLDAKGSERILAEEPTFENPHFSPDGQRIIAAVRRRGSQGTDLWMYDLRTRSSSMFTSDGGRAPIWTPDGNTITYSHLGTDQGIFSKAANGEGDARQIIALQNFHWLIGWTPDARTLAYGVMEPITDDGTSSGSLMALTGGSSKRVVGPGSLWGGRLSPDGRLLAYYVLQGGGPEVYVTQFPQGGARWLIAEGTDPKWSPDGERLYYRAGDRLMAARVETSGAVRVLSSEVVVDPFSPPLYDDYDIHPDARTVVLVRPAGEAIAREVTMVFNWLAAPR